MKIDAKMFDYVKDETTLKRKYLEAVNAAQSTLELKVAEAALRKALKRIREGEK